MKWFLLLCIPLCASIDRHVEEVAQAYLKEHNIQGMAIAVIYENRTLPNPIVRRTYSFGTISKRSRIPVNQHTEFRIGPITETLTGALLALMVRDGRANLADPAAEYLPRSSTLPAFDGKKITLADLATSSSGLPNVPYDLDKRTAVSVSQLFRILRTFQLSGPPGKIYAPSNVGYALLANLISRMGRGNYADLLRDTILRPLRMNDTLFSLGRETKTRRATGYEDGHFVPPNLYERRYSVFLGSGGLFSTVDDMAMWLSFNLRIFVGHLAPILPIMHKPLIDTDPSHSVALGWNVAKEFSRDRYYRGGALFGYSSYMTFIPERRTGVVILSNSGDVSLEPLARNLLTMIQQ